jgi:glycosyltransferase involved in cell wall biosynthesis
MTEPFVSVVTPVYNDEPYLEEAIKSVLAQTHQDFEYIVCNNHSKDRSGEIAGDWAARDPRIRVVKPPEFLPQAKNFNYALQQISPRSKHTKMLLSDDWLYPECVAKMSAVAEADPRISLVSAYRLIETRPDCFGVPVTRTVFDGREVVRWQLLGTTYPFGSQTTVLYSSEAIRKRAPRFFPEDRFFFDVDIAIRMLADTDFGFVHQVLSYSRYQPDAITDVASNFNSWPLLHYVMVEQYGRDFLSAEEFAARYAEVTAAMYQGLGEEVLKEVVRLKKKKGFWEFQKKHLGDIGVEVRPELLARGIVDAGLHFAGAPSELGRKLRNGLKKLST